MSLGIQELLLILLIVLLLFGGKKLPELARALGRAKFEYKKAETALRKEAEEFQKTIESEENHLEHQAQDDTKLEV